MIGRQVKEGDVLYVDVPDDHIATLLEKFRDMLTDEELELIKELRDLRRKLGKL